MNSSQHSWLPDYKQEVILYIKFHIFRDIRFDITEHTHIQKTNK